MKLVSALEGVSRMRVRTCALVSVMTLVACGMAVRESEAQYRRPAARDEDWTSTELPGPTSAVRAREQARAREDVASRDLDRDYRDEADRDYDNRSYDRDYDNRDYDRSRSYSSRQNEGVAPISRSSGRYDAPVDVRYGSDLTGYDPYRAGATGQATPWRPVGSPRPVTAWQVTAADTQPSLGGGYPQNYGPQNYGPASGGGVRPLPGQYPDWARGNCPPGYVSRSALGYNNVPLNAPLNNSFPTTQVSPINNIQPMPGYGNGYAMGGPGQFVGPSDFNRNGWNWGSNRNAGWAPLIPIKAPPTNYVVGQGLWGQPKVYIPDQPIRNGIRYILP